MSETKYNEGSFVGGMGSLIGLDDGTPKTQESKIEKVTGGVNVELTSVVVGPAMLFTDTKEVLLDSGYYPADQPFLPQVLVQFPKKVTSSTTGRNIPIFDDLTDLLEFRPNNLISFSLDDIQDGIASFTLTLFDSSWHKVEDKILSSKGFIRIRYGYADAASLSISSFLSKQKSTLSPWYDCLITNYSIKFGLEGVTLFITGTCTGYSLNAVKVFNAFSQGQKISDIVSKIAGDFGITKKVIEPTEGIKTRESLETTEEGEKIFRQQGQTSLSFIIENLIPFAKSASDQTSGNYKFFIKNTEEGPELHFHTPYYDPSTSSSKQVVPAFTLHKSPNSPVISFDPLWDMSTIQIQGVGHAFSAIIDANTKATIPYTNNLLAVPQKFDNKSGVVVFKPSDFNTEQKEIKTFSRNIVPYRFPKEQKAVLDTTLSKRYIGAIQAILKIQGSVSFGLLDKIAVIIYVPQQNMQTSRNVHWISGYYRIIGIKHDINAGNYITTLTLATDGRSNELLTPVPVSSVGK